MSDSQAAISARRTDHRGRVEGDAAEFFTTLGDAGATSRHRADAARHGELADLDALAQWRPARF
jgi:hypothetical protein